MLLRCGSNKFSSQALAVVQVPRREHPSGNLRESIARSDTESMSGSEETASTGGVTIVAVACGPSAKVYELEEGKENSFSTQMVAKSASAAPSPSVDNPFQLGGGTQGARLRYLATVTPQSKLVTCSSTAFAPAKFVTRDSVTSSACIPPLATVCVNVNALQVESQMTVAVSYVRPDSTSSDAFSVSQRFMIELPLGSPITGRPEEASHLCFHPHYRILAVAPKIRTGQTFLVLWNEIGESKVSSCRNPPGTSAVTTCAFSPSGDRIVTVDEQGVACVWSLALGLLGETGDRSTSAPQPVEINLLGVLPSYHPTSGRVTALSWWFWSAHYAERGESEGEIVVAGHEKGATSVWSCTNANAHADGLKSGRQLRFTATLTEFPAIHGNRKPVKAITSPIPALPYKDSLGERFWLVSACGGGSGIQIWPLAPDVSKTAERGASRGRDVVRPSPAKRLGFGTSTPTQRSAVLRRSAARRPGKVRVTHFLGSKDFASKKKLGYQKLSQMKSPDGYANRTQPRPLPSMREVMSAPHISLPGNELRGLAVVKHFSKLQRRKNSFLVLNAEGVLLVDCACNDAALAFGRAGGVPEEAFTIGAALNDAGLEKDRDTLIVSRKTCTSPALILAEREVRLGVEMWRKHDTGTVHRRFKLPAWPHSPAAKVTCHTTACSPPDEKTTKVRSKSFAGQLQALSSRVAEAEKGLNEIRTSFRAFTRNVQQDMAGLLIALKKMRQEN